MSGVVIRHREPGPHRSSSNSGQRMWRDSFVVQQADTTPHPSEAVKGRPRAAGDEHAVFFAGSTRDARDDRGKLSPSWLPHRSALRSAVPLCCASQWQNPSTHTRLVSAMLTVLLPQCSLGVSHAGHFMVGERHPSAPHPPGISHFTFHPCRRTDLSAHRASANTGFACCWRLLEAEAAGSCAAASM